MQKKENEYVYPIFSNSSNEKDIYGYAKKSQFTADSITITARGDIGKVIYRNQNFCGIGRLLVLKSKCMINKYLYYSLCKSFSFFKELTSIPQLTKPKIINSILFISKNLDEQQKIAKFLSLLDRQIELYVSKLALTEKIKLFYLNNLFTSNWLPKLRFKEFSDDFIKESLKDIYELKKGEQLPSIYKNIHGKYYHLNGGKNYSCKCNHFNTNENVISISEGGESCGYVSWNKEKFWAGGGHLYVIHLLKNYDNQHFYFLLKNYEKNIMKLRVGSSIPNIQKSDLENFKITYSTNINEQHKIAKLLGLHDYYIEFLVKKINSIKQLKKYYLKNLFI